MKRVYGSKYDENLNTTEIAKRFRADVKEAIKAGDLPKDLKMSVKTSYFAGGSAIRVSIKAGAKGPVVNPLYVVHAGHSRGGYPYLMPEATKLKDKVEEMLEAYNHNGSDIQSDYFDYKFYSTVEYDSALTSDEYEKVSAWYKAGADVKGVDSFGNELTAHGMSDGEPALFFTDVTPKAEEPEPANEHLDFLAMVGGL